jgi:hypothetical protein
LHKDLGNEWQKIEGLAKKWKDDIAIECVILSFLKDLFFMYLIHSMPFSTNYSRISPKNKDISGCEALAPRWGNQAGGHSRALGGMNRPLKPLSFWYVRGVKEHIECRRRRV